MLRRCRTTVQRSLLRGQTTRTSPSRSYGVHARWCHSWVSPAVVEPPVSRQFNQDTTAARLRFRHWGMLPGGSSVRLAPRLRCTLRRVRQNRAAPLGVVGQWRRYRAAPLGVVGQWRCDRAASLGVVGQWRRYRAASLGVVGQWRRYRAAPLGVVGQWRCDRAALLGGGVVVGSACCPAIVPCAASTRSAHLTRQFSRQTLSTRHDR
jgi:hypothetical protein